MDNIEKRWTAKEIIKYKKSQFLVLTLIITVYLNSATDKGLTYLMNVDNQAFFTHNYSLGVFGLILVLPAALLSIWIIKGYDSLRNRFLQSEIVNRLGLLKYFERDGVIFKTLSTFFALSLKLVITLFKAVTTIMAGIGLLIFWLASIFSEGSSSSSSSSVGSRPASNGRSSSRGSSNSNNNQKLQANAYWHANKKQEEANFAKKRAVNQARYNINTHHFHDKVNDANFKQREANEAAKRARNI